MTSLRLATVAVCVLAAGCGQPKPAPPATVAAAPDPDAVEARRQADAKAAFEAALAAKDAAKLDELANGGNGFALLHRAQDLLASRDFNDHQSAYSDMEAAAAAGAAEAQLWVGQRMATGTDGYPLKPNSGVLMVEKAAKQGDGPAMLKLGELYQTTLMHDEAKSRFWYQKAAAAGVAGAADALKKMDDAKSEATP